VRKEGDVASAGKNVLITGCSSGLGLGAALEIASRGHSVFATMRDPGKDGDLRHAAAQAGVSVQVVQLDVTDAESVERAVAKVLASAGHIDTVLNNAGTVAYGPIEFSTDDELHSIFETNVCGPVRVARAVLPSMRERKAGRIVNVSSGAARPRIGCRGLPLYAMSKAALNSFTLELCKEVAPLGIEVVLLEGAVFGSTSMTRGLMEATTTADSGPYPHVVKPFQMQFSRDVAPEMTAQTVGFIADACLIDDPPLAYPPDWQGWLVASENLPDERFLRLARLDRSPDLYEDASPPWAANHQLTAG
jgi:NAD(P)-dependent dehydrogenase (short-subunit alcohol dehydrogenase family)